jgi:hypothetical protein
VDPDGTAQLQNIAMRFIQGGFHSLAASLAAFVVWKDTHHRSAFFGFLPFALWPFNAEAVMWRTAGGYPVAALLSVLAVVLVRRQGKYQAVYRLLGAVFIAMAVLFQQVAAVAGPILWFMIVCLHLVRERQPLEFLGIKQLAYLVSGGITGGLISAVIARHYNAVTGRFVVATNLWDRLSYITNLNVRFFSWPDFYPAWLAWAHVALLAVAFVLVLATLLNRNRTFSALLSISFICFATFVFPFAPLLIVAESWPSFRVMYMAPLILSVAWLTVMQLRVSSIFHALAAGLFCVVLLGYVQIAWQNSAEYPYVFEADLQTLKGLSETANRENVKNIFVVTSPEFPLTDWNPYHVKYMHADSKISAFLVDFSADSFIYLFSSLKPTHDAGVQAVCFSFCRTASYDRNSKIDIVEAGSTLCVCP